jgi:repressor LexA
MKTRLKSNDILDQIARLRAAKGYTPSLRELGEALGLSTAGIKHHLDRLSADGLITWSPGMARTIQITDAGRASIKESAAALADGWA